MRYSKVYLEAMGYELPPLVISSGELEERLLPLYKKLNIPEGQIEALTGISERRWWEKGFTVSQGAIAAGRKALAASSVKPGEIDVLIYGGVCREGYEPATACKVAAALGVSPDAIIYDVSNACLGVMNGMVDIANRIELGQSRAGLIVACESPRDIIETTMARMLEEQSMDNFIRSMAALTGGGGGAAMLLTDGTFSRQPRRKLCGGAACAAPQFHDLAWWGVDPAKSGKFTELMYFDPAAILKNGVELGARTWKKFLRNLGWTVEQVNKTICHQVGESNRVSIQKALGLNAGRDFITYPYLGNMGSVSLPITAAIAEEREFLQPGDNVAFLGIASGLNCLMLGLKW